MPIRYGEYIAKISVAPVSPGLTELTGSKVDTAGRPDALREDMRDALNKHDNVWELRVQLCADLEAMPSKMRRRCGMRKPVPIAR